MSSTSPSPLTTLPGKPNSNRAALMLAIALALGSWLMQQTPDSSWGQLVQPYNIGSLLSAIASALVGAYGYTRVGRL